MYKEYAYHLPDDTWSQSYLMPRLLHMLGKPNGPILDLGCGNGSVARALLGLGYDVYGVDASEGGISIAEGLSPGRFFVLDLSAGGLPEPLTKIAFKTVISTEVIEHLYDPRGFIDFAHRILGPGGELIISTPYHGYLKNLVLALLGRMDAHFTVLWDGGHIKFFSRRTMYQMLKEQGFTVHRFVGAGRLPFLWKSMLIKAKAN